MGFTIHMAGSEDDGPFLDTCPKSWGGGVKYCIQKGASILTAPPCMADLYCARSGAGGLGSI